MEDFRFRLTRHTSICFQAEEALSWAPTVYSDFFSSLQSNCCVFTFLSIQCSHWEKTGHFSGSSHWPLPLCSSWCTAVHGVLQSNSTPGFWSRLPHSFRDLVWCSLCVFNYFFSLEKRISLVILSIFFIKVVQEGCLYLETWTCMCAPTDYARLAWQELFISASLAWWL